MDLLEFFRCRRTVRRFEQRDVAEKELLAIMDCVRFSSCAANKQRLRYLIVRTPEKVRRIVELTNYAALVKPHRDPEWNKTAPRCFIAVTAPQDAGEIILADAGAAIQTMEYAAWNLGIGCCWIASFDKTEVPEVLELPDNEKLLYVVALGYPAEHPVSEDTAADVRYYLDGKDQLHVPKLTVDRIVKWC